MAKFTEIIGEESTKEWIATSTITGVTLCKRGTQWRVDIFTNTEPQEIAVRGILSDDPQQIINYLYELGLPFYSKEFIEEVK